MRWRLQQRANVHRSARRHKWLARMCVNTLISLRAPICPGPGLGARGGTGAGREWERKKGKRGEEEQKHQTNQRDQTTKRRQRKREGKDRKGMGEGKREGASQATQTHAKHKHTQTQHTQTRHTNTHNTKQTKTNTATHAGRRKQASKHASMQASEACEDGGEGISRQSREKERLRLLVASLSAARAAHTPCVYI